MIPGFLDDLEGLLLHLLAAEGPGSGAVVEVGSFMGKSTAWLASGSLSARSERVAAMDHFGGSPEHEPRLARRPIDHRLRAFDSLRSQDAGE